MAFSIKCVLEDSWANYGEMVYAGNKLDLDNKKCAKARIVVREQFLIKCLVPTIYHQ